MNLLETLKSGITEVTFTKRNGDIRIMLCTLDPALIPVQEETEKTERVVKTKPVGLFCVIDVETGEWRSFNEDQVISFKKI